MTILTSHGKMCFLCSLVLSIRVASTSGFAAGYDWNMLGKWEGSYGKNGYWQGSDFQHKLYRPETNGGKETWTQYDANDGTSYQIKMIPRKILRIKKGGEGGGKTTWNHYDVWGFFQGKFEDALENWKIPSSELIHEGKQKRDSFTEEDLEFMVRYNAQECKTLVQLMDSLYSKLEQVKLVPASWHGAGAIASRLLAESKCRKSFKPKITKQLDEWQRFAYFGGRIELVHRAKHMCDIYSYDINSAYPHSTLTMPAIDGEWESVSGAELKPDDFALVQVEWDFPNCRVGPLPFRLENGYVLFPDHGKGIYHNIEVQAMMRYCEKWKPEGQTAPWTYKLGKALRLKRPYHYPLQAYVDGRAKQRLAYKKAKDFAHIPIKLGLNALYGKFAQRPQYQGHKPVYRQLLVAGYITAHTRAELLLTCDPETVVLFATDSIKSKSKLDVKVGEALGEWEPEFWKEARFLMAGVYQYLGEDGKWHLKTRGLHNLDVEAALKAQVYYGPNENVGEGGFAALDMQFMGVKRSLANFKAYREPCRFYPLTKLIDWNQNNKRDHWTRDGESLPTSDFEEPHSTIYTTKFEEGDEAEDVE